MKKDKFQIELRGVIILERKVLDNQEDIHYNLKDSMGCDTVLKNMNFQIMHLGNQT